MASQNGSRSGARFLSEGGRTEAGRGEIAKRDAGNLTRFHLSSSTDIAARFLSYRFGFLPATAKVYAELTGLGPAGGAA